MAIFVARRAALIAVLLLAVSVLIFSLQFISPGGPIEALVGPRPVSQETIQELTIKYHLNDPFLVQYWRWLGSVLHLDFGSSIQSGQPVTTILTNASSVTVFLGLYAFCIATVFGISLGSLAAVTKGSLLDRLIVGFAVLGSSSPVFVTGVVLLYVLGVKLSWIPIYGAGSGFVDRAWHLTAPAVALAIGVTAVIVKVTRTSLVSVLEQDYISFALARGVPRIRVLVRHGLRNALVPVVTISGTLLGGLLTGAVIAETIFSLPGLGYQLIEAVTVKDVPVLQGIALLFAAVVAGVSLLVDLLYPVIDPRIVLGRSPR